jgi:hypothetical protein
MYLSDLIRGDIMEVEDVPQKPFCVSRGGTRIIRIVSSCTEIPSTAELVVNTTRSQEIKSAK